MNVIWKESEDKKAAMVELVIIPRTVVPNLDTPIIVKIAVAGMVRDYEKDEEEP